MLLFVMYVFALLVQQTLVGFLQDPETMLSHQESTEIFEYYGSVQARAN